MPEAAPRALPVPALALRRWPAGDPLPSCSWWRFL